MEIYGSYTDSPPFLSFSIRPFGHYKNHLRGYDSFFYHIRAREVEKRKKNARIRNYFKQNFNAFNC